jgi:hypothetical protein
MLNSYYSYSAIFVASLLWLGCKDVKPKPQFLYTQHYENIRVTLLRIEKRNVFLSPEGARRTNVEMQIVPGFSVAYVVEPVNRITTNEPYFFMPDLILVENGKPRSWPTPQDVPKGFNPAAQRSFWFQEYKDKFFPNSEHPMVRNPSNAVVYVNEQSGVRITNTVVDLAIQAAVPNSKAHVFVFKSVPID